MWQIGQSAARGNLQPFCACSQSNSNWQRLALKKFKQHTDLQSLYEDMASCSGRMHTTEVQHSFLAQHLPSRRLQRCLRIIYPDSLLRFGRQKRDVQVTCAAADVAEVKGKASRMPSLPFVKVADQEDMKLALMLNVIDPTIGGVLIMGERGTGKSVAVRYITALVIKLLQV